MPRAQTLQEDLGKSHHVESNQAECAHLGTSHQSLNGSAGADLDPSHPEDKGASKVGEETQIEVEGGADVLLEGADFKNYQQQAARANYLCLDRPDIGFATKELMRRMAAPTEDDYAALKKLGRYLMGRPRLVSTFRYGESSSELIIEGDSDHAGCLRTRKSTSGWGDALGVPCS